MKITMEWAWSALAHHLPSDPTVWDPSGVVAAVARHQSDLVLVAGQPEPDLALRAAAFLHTLAVCPPLDSPMNEFYAAAATRSYLGVAGAKALPSPMLLADLVDAAKQGRADIFAVAEQLRSVLDG
ncbi:hypothetical protein [Streptomyces abikoensis]|uniref:hypothetical protein n=1 Tax=Streptomyces abikoensis TaxID=97398 RepID=UPI0019B80F6B|nr:hypothetical protein [Streptomyces abikoensis]GGP72541.1 hypothetical protein GCM10010214_54470 [Streptomyces abikoensis]